MQKVYILLYKKCLNPDILTKKIINFVWLEKKRVSLQSNNIII